MRALMVSVCDCQVSMGVPAGERSAYSAVGLWDAADPNLSLLNQETPRDLPLIMSIGADLVIGEAQRHTLTGQHSF